MRVTKDEVNVRMEIPGAIIRQRTGFGTVKGFDAISAEYFTLSAGVDTTPLFQGLEGNSCQSPHWGFVLRGQITTTEYDAANRVSSYTDSRGTWDVAYDERGGLRQLTAPAISVAGGAVVRPATTFRSLQSLTVLPPSITTIVSRSARRTNRKSTTGVSAL